MPQPQLGLLPDQKERDEPSVSDGTGPIQGQYSLSREITALTRLCRPFARDTQSRLCIATILDQDGRTVRSRKSDPMSITIAPQCLTYLPTLLYQSNGTQFSSQGTAGRASNHYTTDS